MRFFHTLSAAIALAFLVAGNSAPAGAAASKASESSFGIPAISVRSGAQESKVDIETTFVFPQKQTESEAAQCKSQNTEGIYSVVCNPAVTKISRRIGSHVVDLTLRMNPARGGGFGGAFETWSLKVDVDNKPRLASYFGHVHYLDINVQRIQVYPEAKDHQLTVTVQDESDGSVHFVSVGSAEQSSMRRR